LTGARGQPVRCRSRASPERQPDVSLDESGLLHAFDRNRGKTCAAAAKLYVRGSKGSYDLAVADF